MIKKRLCWIIFLKTYFTFFHLWSSLYFKLANIIFHSGLAKSRVITKNRRRKKFVFKFSEILWKKNWKFNFLFHKMDSLIWLDVILKISALSWLKVVHKSFMTTRWSHRCSTSSEPQRRWKFRPQQGRILLYEAEGWACLTYTATSLDVNKLITAATDKTLYNIVWINKMYYIKKSVLMNSYENGGFIFLILLLSIPYSKSTRSNYLSETQHQTGTPTTYKIGGLNFLLIFTKKKSITATSFLHSDL